MEKQDLKNFIKFSLLDKIGVYFFEKKYTPILHEELSQETFI